MFREMRRHAQQIDQATCEQVLRETRRGMLAILGDEGWPYGIPLNFVFDPTRGEHGSLYFHAALEGHKIDALRRSNKVCFTVMDEGYQNEGEWWWYVRSVVCFCRAHIIEDPQVKHDALFALGSKYFPPEKDIEADIAKNAHRVNMVELEIVHMTGKLVQEK